MAVNRPEKIYLDEPITLHGIKVGHTHAGLKYLIDHYTTTMNNATDTQLTTDNRQHCQKMIDNMRIHLELYERELNPKTP